MERKLTQTQDIDRAKITSAVSAMRTMLAAASQAAHDLKASHEEFQDEEYRNFDRVQELGYLVDIASTLCAADLKMLFDVAVMMLKIHNEEEEGLERAFAN